MLTPDQIAEAAALLWQARRSLQRLPALPEGLRPASEDEAYAIQDAYVGAIIDGHGGADRIGYKVGCTNVTAQEQLGLNAPFRGVLLSPYVKRSGAELSFDHMFMAMIEAEIGFRMAKDLPGRDSPYEAADMAGAVASVFPALEIVDSRYDDWTTIGAPHLIADNACTGYWLYGEEIEDVARFDFSDFPVQVYRNGEAAETGNSRNVLGHPFNALAWLANSLNAAGKMLSAGDLVSTGTTILVNPAGPGDHVAAEYGDLGRIEVFFQSGK